MSDATAKELAALLLLCRNTASVYRKMDKSDPQQAAAIFDALGDRLAALLSDKR